MPAMKACTASGGVGGTLFRADGGGGGGGGASPLFCILEGARFRTDGVECADSAPSSLELARTTLLCDFLARLLTIIYIVNSAPLS